MKNKNMMIKMNDNPTINKISKDVEDLAKLLSNIGYFKTEKDVCYKFESNKIVQTDESRFKELVRTNVFLYGINPERFVPILKENLKVISNYEFNLLNNIENINHLKSSVDEIEANKEKEIHDAADMSVDGIILYLISIGFFAISDVINPIYRYDESKIKRYDIDALKEFLSDFENGESLFLTTNYSSLVQKLPKVRNQDFYLWETLIGHDSTVADGIADLNNLKNMMNY